MPTEYNHDHLNEITLFGETNYRNERRRFGIKTDDRRRHMYVIGKTGMGKTTLMENLIVQDIQNGHGCCYIDPHGDTAETLLDFIPSNRINDVVYFNPSDIEYPVGFNILETESDEQKPLIASGLMGVFKKIWPDVWSARMEYILMNCVLALLDYPGATLLGINRILVDKEYRTRVVQKIRDPIVKTFWIAEFAGWSEKYATEAIAPVQNKVGQFLSSSVIRNMVAQVKSSVNLRRVMDDGKILVGGGFTAYNGVPRNGLARLESNGALDTSFNIGLGFQPFTPGGSPRHVYSVAVQDDGKIVVAGALGALMII